MVNVIDTPKQRIALINKFFYSESFPLIVGIVCAFSWIMQAQTLCMFILSVVSTYILFTQEDMTPLLAPLILLCFCIHDPSKLDIIKLACIGVPLICGAMYHLVEYKGKNGFGKMFIPFLILTAVMCLGGIFSPYLKYFGNSIMYIGSLGVFLMLLYVLFYKYITPPDGFDLRVYLCIIFEVAAVAGVLELVFRWTTENKDVYDLAFFGWGTYNQIGACFLIGYPCFFYMMCRNNRLFPELLLAGLVFVVCVLSGCDGAKGLLGVFTPFLLFFTVRRLAGKQKIILKRICYALIVFVGLAVAYLLIKNPKYIQSVLSHFTDDNARSILYATGFNDFLSYPIFGVGLGQPLAVGVVGGNFHSTFIHVGATLGTVGLVTYVFYFAIRIKIINSDVKLFNTFIFFSFVMLEVYGFVDTCEFTPFPTMMQITLIVLFCDILHEKNVEDELSIPQYRQELMRNRKRYNATF